MGFQSLVFGFCQQRWRFFGFFCLMHQTVFLDLPRKLHPAVELNLQSRRPLTVRGMHNKPSLFSRRYLRHNGCQAGYKNLMITSKQMTISQISHACDNMLWTLTLDCRPLSFYSAHSRVVSPFPRRNNIALTRSVHVV